MQAKGFVLRSHVSAESDLWVDFLDHQGTLLHLLARGAKNSKRRFGGGALEALQYVGIVYEIKGEQKYLQEAKILAAFDGIRSHYDKVVWGSKILALARVYAKEDLEEPGLFHLVGNSLRALEWVAVEGSELLYWHFVVRLMALQGDLAGEKIFHEFLAKPIGSLTEHQLFCKKLPEVRSRLKQLFQQSYQRNLEDL